MMERMNAFDENRELSRAERRRIITEGNTSVEKMSGLDRTTSVFGIDLGTTNSAISVVQQGDKPNAIKLINGKYTMPSCVMWKNGEFIVGEEAYSHREYANVIYSVKRYMQDPTKTVTLKDGSATLEMTPAEVSAEILKGLIEQTGGVYGEIKDVVVTVPAYFDQNGRNATREACELAGLNLIDIINEPTAASLNMQLSDANEDFIVFDFGGGTLDITLARIVNNEDNSDLLDLYDLEDDDETPKENGSQKKIIQCKAIEGNSYLGGDDIDLELLEIVGKRIEDETGVTLSEFDREYREGLLLRLEGFKKMGVMSRYLLAVETNTVTGKSINCKISVSTEDFINSLVPVYRKCKKVMDTLLAKIENSAKKVYLVGGSTKNPLLVDMLKNDYPDFVFSSLGNPDLAVTLGAAIKGKIDKFGSENVQIFDVLPISIGIEEEGGKVTYLLESGSVLPTTKSMTFTNVTDNQKRMELKVLQGKSNYADECVLLGMLTFDDLPPAKEGELYMSVRLSVSAKSELKCIGSVNGVEQELKLSLTGKTSIGKKSKEERKIRRWMIKAEQLQGKNRAKAIEMIKGYPAVYNQKQITDFLMKQANGGIV